MLLEVFKCFLCACAANDAGRKATASPPQELDVKRLVYIYGRILHSSTVSVGLAQGRPNYAVLLLISLLLHALISAACAGMRLYRQTPDF